MGESIFIICGAIPNTDTWEIIHAFYDEQDAFRMMNQLENENDDRMKKECEGTQFTYIPPTERRWRRYWIENIPYKGEKQ